MLIHWPGAARTAPDSPSNAALRLETWRALEAAQAAGLVRAVGVSNFTIAHLKHLQAHASTRICVNQVEVHPRLQQQELRQYCAASGIAVVAYSSLGCGDLLQNKVVCNVAHQEGVAPATLLLRWALQQGICVIPKSCTPARVVAMAPDVLLGQDIGDDAFAVLNSLEDGHKYCWDASAIT